jgi:acetyl-CoA carboxylase biotin carboxylase subunit
MTAALRARMASAAVAVAREVGYTSAGTIEFLVDADGGFYFLEMNTRLQVEHPVTELVTGVDLVAWQLRIARGETLAIDPARALTPAGHAIECRIYAEDPDQRFLPAPGRITHFRPAGGPGIRDDSGVAAGFTVPIFYDSMIAKLAAWGVDRPQAIARLRRALAEYEVGGIRTTIPFFQWLVDTERFHRADFDTTTLDEELARRAGEPFRAADEGTADVAALGAALEAFARAGRGTPGAAALPASRWRQVARADGLR